MSGRDDDARLPHVDGKTHAARIATLNDALRRRPFSGRLTVTAGVIALGDRTLPAILRQVATYDRFDANNDPYGEHDFGSFEHGGERLFWKIYYYSHDLRMGSPDPACPAVTTRVLTIMLAGNIDARGDDTPISGHSATAASTRSSRRSRPELGRP